MGSQEHTGDVGHRYELRRALLRSGFLVPRMSRWDRMMTYTAPLMAGGVMVGMFALLAVNVSSEPEIGPQTVSSPSPVAQTAALLEVAPIRAEDFLSPVGGPTVLLANFKAEESVHIRHIPLAHEYYVRTQ